VRRYIVVYLSFSRRIQFAYILSVRRVPAVRTPPSLFKIKILLRPFLTDLNWTLVEYLFSIFFSRPTRIVVCGGGNQPERTPMWLYKYRYKSAGEPSRK